MSDQIEAKPADNSRTVVLRVPIMAHSETVDRLTFREPTGADIQAHGLPVNYDFSGDTPKAVFDAKAMGAMMSTLAAVPPSSIGKLSAKDWTTCCWTLTRFFMPEWEQT